MATKRVALLRFVLIMGVLLVSGMIFATLAEDIVNHETFFSLDPVLGTWLLARTSLTGDKLFSSITLLGNALFISSGTGLFGLWFAKEQRWRQLVFLFTAVGGAAILNLILKNVFLRPRPDFPLAFLHDTGYSFPSGHAMISIAFYGTVAYLLFTRLKSWRIKILVVLGVAMIASLIGFSRLYLGVHYLSDVLGGWSAGALWLSICVLGEDFLVLSKKRAIKKYSFVKIG